MNDKSVICLLNNKVIRVYEEINSVEKDGFLPKIIKDCIKSGETYYKCLWKYKKDVSEDIINLYLMSENYYSNYLTDIIKCDSKGNYLCTYKYQEISIIKKILKKSITDRLYKNYYWYRLGEYVDMNPTISESDIIYNNNSFSDTALTIVLTITDKLISVNDLYKARVQYSHGKPIPIVYKNPKAVKISQANRNQLLSLDLSQYKPWLEKTDKYSIDLNFVLKSGISTRDLGNVEKQISDDIVRYIREDLGVEHFDDSEFLEMSMNKSIIPEAKKEYVFIQLKESFHSIRFDIIEKPEKVYLDCQDNKYIELFKSDILKNNLGIYISGSDKYNPEYSYDEKINKCNVILKVITPDMGQNAILILLELVKNINSCIERDKGFIWVSIVGKEEDWKDYWKVLNEFVKSILDNYKTSRVKIIKFSKGLDDFIK